MKPIDLKNKWVLLTGASSGLGYEMACQLAYKSKTNLVLLARRAEILEALKNKLEKEASVQVKVIVGDLAKPGEADRLIDQILNEVELSGAILNAGITYFGRNTEITSQQFNDLLQINVVSTVRMTDRIISYFEKNNKEGALMLVSSMAGIYPVPFQAAYSASKAFILSYGNALSYELKNKNFSITVYAPGGIETEMTANKKFEGLKKWLMPVNTAAREAIHAFSTRKHLHIPGFTNKLGYIVMKFLPKKFLSAQMGNVYLRALTQSEMENKK
jgi:short-subunit dehydrogenase